jgi:ElaB/YqjD/DUF883 family membrane-anchored ribosome-binding protein
VSDVSRAEHDQPPIPDDQAALHADIEETRERLGETADEIVRRLDVRERMKDVARGTGQRAGEVRQRANEVGQQAGAYCRSHPRAVAGGGAAIGIAVGLTIAVCRRRRVS